MEAKSYKKLHVEVKKRSTAASIISRFKEKTVILHPTLLTYVRNSKNKTDLTSHEIDEITQEGRERLVNDPKFYDFLLAPLGNTILTQIDDNKLLIALQHKKFIAKHNDEVVALKSATVFQELTLRFETKEERNHWMTELINECDRIYLQDFIDVTEWFEPGFDKEVNRSIWSRIIVGEEHLRIAYSANLQF
jgi:hypothetical protein